MAPRVPNHIIQQRPMPPSGQYPMDLQQSYPGNNAQQPWSQQQQPPPQMISTNQQPQQPQPHFVPMQQQQQFPTENYVHSGDATAMNRSEYHDALAGGGYSGYRSPAPPPQFGGPQNAVHGIQSPGSTARAPMAPWSGQVQQSQPFSQQLPPRSQSVAPMSVQSPPPPRSPLTNGLMPQQSSQHQPVHHPSSLQSQSQKEITSPEGELERQKAMTTRDFLLEAHIKFNERQTALESEIAKVWRQIPFHSMSPC